MTNLVQTIAENKQWIFSGIGVFILGLLVSFVVYLYRKHKGSSPAGRPEQEAQTASVVQKGDGATTVQQGRSESGHVINIHAPAGNVSLGNVGATSQPRPPQYDELRRIGGGLGSSGSKPAESRSLILYDSSLRCQREDFETSQERLWKERDQDDSPKGLGVLSLLGDVLNIERSNKGGRFRLAIRRYNNNGTILPYIRRNTLIEGTRVFRMNFDAKAIGGQHKIVLYMKRLSNGDVLDSKTVVVTDNQWREIEVTLRVSPNDDCDFWIDSEGGELPSSSLQLKNLIIREPL